MTSKEIFLIFLKDFDNVFEGDKHIDDKEYLVTLIRDLLILNMYQLYKLKIIERDDILKYLKNKDISNVYKSIRKVRSYIANPNFLDNNTKKSFNYFNFKFKKTQKKIKNKYYGYHITAQR
ncbi:hypothetical protein [Ornithobacterium rhinotracheale]